MRGEVVTVLFPFSNLAVAKRRPALVLIDLPGKDVVLAAITSTGTDPNAITLQRKDFASGRLLRPSFILPAKLFTIERTLVEKSIGKISEEKRLEVIQKLTELLK